MESNIIDPNSKLGKAQAMDLKRYLMDSALILNFHNNQNKSLSQIS